jgi:hypothetical protein
VVGNIYFYGTAPKADDLIVQSRCRGELTLTSDPGEVCTAVEQEVQLNPVNLVITLDRSASMGDSGVPGDQLPKNAASRWTPVKNGLIAFMTGAKRSSVAASLTYFPMSNDGAASCANSYTTPDVPLTSLKTPIALVTSLNSTDSIGGTPTLSAVYGGITYARKLESNDPAAQTSVVLISDGAPGVFVTETAITGDLNHDGVISSYEIVACVPSALSSSGLQNRTDSIVPLVSAAADGKPPIPTYVIGIGPSVASLAPVATAGGSNYVSIETTDPAVTQNAITDTLETILASAACTVNIPSPPSGQSFDASLTNVNYSLSDGTVKQFVRSDTCSTIGWHYDTPFNPTKIVLCPPMCAEIATNAGGILKVLFGCKSRTE